MNHLTLKEKWKQAYPYSFKVPAVDEIFDWWLAEIAAREERLVEEIEKLLWDWPREIVTTMDAAKKAEYREYLKARIIELIQHHED